MQVIAVAGQKGGAGKTTLALNVAEALRLQGRRVVVVDTDPQGSARYWRDLAEEQGHTDSVAVMGASGTALLSTLRALEPSADIVVIDTPPRMSAEARAAMVAASVVLSPVSMGGPDVWALEQTAQTVAEVKATRTDGGPRVLVVLNRIDTRTALARTLPDAVKAQGFDIAQTVIANRVAWAEATGLGQTIPTYAPSGAEMEQLSALLAEVLP